MKQSELEARLDMILGPGNWKLREGYPLEVRGEMTSSQEKDVHDLFKEYRNTQNDQLLSLREAMEAFATSVQMADKVAAALVRTATAEMKQAREEFSAVIAAILTDKEMADDIKIGALMEFINAGNLHARYMYAQQSQVEEFNRTGANLLTLSRDRVFPFTTRVMVIS